jgi:transcriptional regulator with XRE-family HTH domain
MTLQEYIEGYIKQHNLSIREFARLCGVNHQAMFNILNKPEHKPDVITLGKISDYTGISIVTLLKMVYPESFRDVSLSPQGEIVAQAFENAPESVQDLVLRLVGLK